MDESLTQHVLKAEEFGRDVPSATPDSPRPFAWLAPIANEALSMRRREGIRATAPSSEPESAWWNPSKTRCPPTMESRLKEE
jgi:hypothetical protein